MIYSFAFQQYTKKHFIFCYVAYCYLWLFTNQTWFIIPHCRLTVNSDVKTSILGVARSVTFGNATPIKSTTKMCKSSRSRRTRNTWGSVTRSSSSTTAMKGRALTSRRRRLTRRWEKETVSYFCSSTSVFLKDRSVDHLWSAKILQVVRENCFMFYVYVIKTKRLSLK